jgi:two-component system sensor histidine kinase RegB
MLLPAILNLLQNAVFANQKHAQVQLELSWQKPDAQNIALIIRDFGTGFSSSELAELGGQLMPSEQGMGIAVMLSNVTFERLNGSLTVYNHPEGGAVAKITMPLLTAEAKA